MRFLQVAVFCFRVLANLASFYCLSSNSRSPQKWLLYKLFAVDFKQVQSVYFVVPWGLINGHESGKTIIIQDGRKRRNAIRNNRI